MDDGTGAGEIGLQYGASGPMRRAGGDGIGQSVLPRQFGADRFAIRICAANGGVVGLNFFAIGVPAVRFSLSSLECWRPLRHHPPSNTPSFLEIRQLAAAADCCHHVRL